MLDSSSRQTSSIRRTDSSRGNTSPEMSARQFTDLAEDSSKTWRSIHVGNIPSDATPSDLLDLVNTGPIESVRFLPHKNCALVLFLNDMSGLHFFVDAELRRPSIRGSVLQFEWAKAPPISPQIEEAVERDGACRNVYLGALPAAISKQELWDALSAYGKIETIKHISETRVAFAHYLSIRSAMTAIERLPKEHAWAAEAKISYGKDRAMHVSKSQQALAALYLGVPREPRGQANDATGRLLSPQSMATALAQMATASVLVASMSGGPANIGNRTVYLGSIHPDAKVDDICNATRGGDLHSIRYFPEKHFAFVTFVEPMAAAQFLATWTIERLIIMKRVVRVSWGKHPGPMNPELLLAVDNGATRNVYVGGIPSDLSEAQVRQDFSAFGEVEQINFLRAKSCVFINFTSIERAIGAISRIRQHPRYSHLIVRHGKDRCSKAPRILENPDNLRLREEGPIMLQFISRAQQASGPFALSSTAGDTVYYPQGLGLSGPTPVVSQTWAGLPYLGQDSSTASSPEPGEALGDVNDRRDTSPGRGRVRSREGLHRGSEASDSSVDTVSDYSAARRVFIHSTPPPDGSFDQDDDVETVGDDDSELEQASATLASTKLSTPPLQNGGVSLRGHILA